MMFLRSKDALQRNPAKPNHVLFFLLTPFQFASIILRCCACKALGCFFALAFIARQPTWRPTGLFLTACLLFQRPWRKVKGHVPAGHARSLLDAWPFASRKTRAGRREAKAVAASQVQCACRVVCGLDWPTSNLVAGTETRTADGHVLSTGVVFRLS